VSESGHHLNNPYSFPFGYSLDTPRDHLIAALTVGSTESQARVIVDALDAYLEADSADRRPTFQWSPPNHEAELIRQRDEAVARAEKAEQELAEKKRRPKAIKKTNGHAATATSANR